MVPANRHGILYEDIGATHETITSVLATLCGSVSPKPKDEAAPAATQPADGKRARDRQSGAQARVHQARYDRRFAFGAQ
jgi:hypothetical protein